LKSQISKIDKLMELSNELMKKMPKEEEKKDGSSEDVLDVQPENKDNDKK